MGMMINRRRIYGNKKGLLPAGYTQLEYIENTSNAYIDTSVYPSGNIKIEAHHKTADTQRLAWSVFWGVSASSSSMLSFHKKNGSDGSFTNNGIYINAGSVNNRFMFTDTEKDLNYTYEINGITLTYKDATHDISISISGNIEQNQRSIYLFAYNEIGIITWNTYAKMYYFRIYNNGTLVRNFIPCINPNNVVGMYDTVNGVFYSSPNGTAFIAGPEV